MMIQGLLNASFHVEMGYCNYQEDKSVMTVIELIQTGVITFVKSTQVGIV